MPPHRNSSAAARKKRDSHAKPYQIVPDGFIPEIIPLDELTQKDIILGRGTTVAYYHGNIRFRQILTPFRKSYQKAPVPEKRQIAEEALAKVGGRFVEVLEWDASGESPTLFQTVTPARGMEKTCQSLREQKWKVTMGKAAFKHARSAADIARQVASSGQAVFVDYHLRSPEVKEAKIMEWHNKKDKAANTNTASSSRTKKTTKRQVSPPKEPETESDNDTDNDEEENEPEKSPPAQLSRSKRYAARGARMEATAQLEVADNNEAGLRRSSRRSKSASPGSPSVPQPARKKKINKSSKAKKTTVVKKKAASAKAQKAPRRRSYMTEAPTILVDLKITDVAFGRSHAQVHHPGNQFFRQFITFYRKKYNMLSSVSKKNFAIDLVKEYPGRFVEIAPGKEDQYRLASMDRTTEKVQQALRELKWSASINDFAKQYKPGKTKPQYPLEKKVALDTTQKSPSSEVSVLSTDPTIDSTPQSSSDEEDVTIPKVEERKSRKKGEGPVASNQRPRKQAGIVHASNSKPREKVEPVATKAIAVKMHEFEEPVPSNPILKVGKRIAVFWPKDSCFYSAVCEDVKSDIPSAPSVEAFTLHKIKYDLDKKSEWIDLSAHKWKYLKHKSDMPEGMLIIIPEGKTVATTKPSKVAKKEATKKVVTSKKRAAETALHAEAKKSSSDSTNSDGSKKIKIMKSGTTKQTKARRSIFFGKGSGDKPTFVF